MGTAKHRRRIPRRAPGRPAAGAADHRESLLSAACVLFSTQGVAATPLRQVALHAQVTPALAHYYFTDRAGLLDAVVEQRIAPLVAGLAAAVRAVDPHAPLDALREFVRGYTVLAARHPWLPQLLLREVLNPQGALRTSFPQRFASGMSALLRELIRNAQQRGEIRPQLDPAKLVMSMISLCIFPFIATPLVVDTLGIPVGPDQAADLHSHHLAVLLHGIASPP